MVAAVESSQFDHTPLLLLLLFSCSVVSALYDLIDCSTPGFPVLHYFPELLKLMSIESVMPSNHLILCCPLLLLPSVFPRIRVFSSELALHIRWPKYWNFSTFVGHIAISRRATKWQGS